MLKDTNVIPRSRFHVMAKPTGPLCNLDCSLGLLPRLPYMTKMDYFILGSTLLVFMALVEVIVTSSLVHSNREKLARKIDRLARFIFPVFFLLVFGRFLFG